MEFVPYSRFMIPVFINLICLMLILFYITWWTLEGSVLMHYRKWIKSILMKPSEGINTEFSSKEFFIPYPIRILWRMDGCWASTWTSGTFHLFQPGFVGAIWQYPLGICKVIPLLQWHRNALKPEANVKLLSVPHRPQAHFKTEIFGTANGGGGICTLSWDY